MKKDYLFIFHQNVVLAFCTQLCIVLGFSGFHCTVKLYFMCLALRARITACSFNSVKDNDHNQNFPYIVVEERYDTAIKMVNY